MNTNKDLNFKRLLKSIKAIVLDVDGVLSKSVVTIHKDGELIRTTNVKDGFALKHALENGLNVCIITGGFNTAVKERYNALGIKDFYLASSNKLKDLGNFLQKYNLKPEDIVYMGDDLPDYEVMSIVGVPVCPADACVEIKSISVYISEYRGGEGCVRDIIEQIMRTQGKWFKNK